ncbi:MAG TPA: winged helix DNA-binding domain-containing protein [Pseudonocardiaceae bacterium]
MVRGFTTDRRRLATLRLAALGISRPASNDPVQVVRELLAVQAQDYEGALWAIGLRTAAASRAEIEAAHEAGAIVRSWPMRGTLHFVAAEDLGWMLTLTAERILRSAAGRHRQLELGASDFDRGAEIAYEALHGGRSLERRELLRTFDAAGLSTAGQRGAHLLLALAVRGHLVLRGKNTWTLAEEWITRSRELAHDEALHELAVRYFRSHGPATVRDLARWSSLTLTDARRAAASARGRLEAVEVEGTEYLMRPGLEPASDGVWLLPGFDEYLLGYADRSAALAGADSAIVAPGGNGLFRPTVVIDGEVVGVWRRTTLATSVQLALEPFDSISPGARGRAARAASRYGRFLAVPARVDGP